MIHRICEFVVLCDANGCEAQSRYGSVTAGEAEECARQTGWQECMHGRWLCPNCAQKQNEAKEGTNG